MDAQLHLQLPNLCIFDFQFHIIALNTLVNHFPQLQHLPRHSLITMLDNIKFLLQLSIGSHLSLDEGSYTAHCLVDSVKGLLFELLEQLADLRGLLLQG